MGYVGIGRGGASGTRSSISIISIPLRTAGRARFGIRVPNGPGGRVNPASNVDVVK